jgi:uncharacterized protein (DUF362 family)
VNSVALVKYKDSISKALEEGLAHIGGFGVLESPVLVKPNICTISDDTGYSVTRVETVRALIEMLLRTNPMKNYQSKSSNLTVKVRPHKRRLRSLDIHSSVMKYKILDLM